MRQFINYIWYKGIEWYTNRAIFFYVIYTETLLPSGAGFRMLVVMSCGRGHVMYHILSHSDLHFAFLFYFFTSFRILWRGYISPRTHISYPQLDSDVIFWILSAIFPNVPLRFMHIGGPFRSFLILLHSGIVFPLPFLLSFLSKMWNLYVEALLYTSGRSLPSGLQK